MSPTPPSAVAKLLPHLRDGLIVSCQALADEPLHGATIMARMALAARLSVPVIAEGRIRTPAEARAALDAGAYAVVVGAAITRPRWITAQFVGELHGMSS